MPSKKGSIAYKARNARKQADRWIKNLSNIVTSKKYTLNERATARQMVNKLEEIRRQTYKPKGKATRESDSIITQATERIKALAKSAKISRGKSGASNLLTQQQINIASRKYERPEDNTSMYTKEEVKAFYRATQKWWENSTKVVNSFDTGVVDQSQINKTIMKKLGTDSLADAFEFITQRPEVKRAIVGYKVGEGKLSETEMTDEQRKMYEQLQTEDNSDTTKGSPPYVLQVIQFGNDELSLRELRAEFRAWKKGKTLEE